MAKVLIVIDMLNDFVNEKGVLQFPQAREIIDFVKRKIEEAKKNGDYIIFLMDSHKENDLEFNLFPKHSVKNTWGSELIDQLAYIVNKSLIGGAKEFFVKKTRYSGFYGTDLEKILAKIKPEEVGVVGVCTSICVMDTVGGLRNRDYKVKVYADGVADFSDEAHAFSLGRMSSIYGATIV
jgi:nicotinamidase/pyrazinamidase